MAYIKDVQVGSDVYLIEPALYIAPSKNGAAYTATLTNFSLVTGATVQAKFAATNDANATLNVNSTGAKEIWYNGAKITASQFKVNHTYTLTYDGTQWQVVGDIDTNNAGITSVTIGATSPVQSSTSTAQTGSSASTTISLKDAYGDTKNPYGTKAKNLVLAGPSSGNDAVPSFRALDAADIPSSVLKWQTTTAASTELYNFGVYVNMNNANGSSMNSGNFFNILNVPYRKASGNTKADWGWQLGNTTANDGRLWYRTSGNNVWGDWQTIAHAAQSTSNIGSATQPVYMTAAGVITAGTALKALAYKDSLTSADIPDIGNTYLKLSGGTMTGDIEGNASVALGTTTNPFHNIVLGGSVSNTLTADSTNPRITFQESNNGTQPVHLIYSDYDSYRSPAGLKITGGTSASPAWLEVEGNIYAAAFKGNADTATSAATATNAANTQSNYGAQSFIVEGDADTYYPVHISGYTSHGAWTLLNISRDYADKAPDTWNTASHKGGLVLTILSNGNSAWGGNHQIGINKLNTILDLSQQYSTMVADITVTNFGLVVWLRGGGARYWITSNGGQSVTVTPHYESYTASSSTVEPTTTINTARIDSYRWNNLWVINKANAANITTTANAIAYYTNTTGTFGSKASANGALYATSANGALQWGTLPIAQGGTGVVSFTKNQVILSDNTNGTTGLTSRAYSDSTSAGALSNTSTNFVTERDVYFGLPTLNNAHNYTSSSTYYAPTTGGTAGHVLIGAGATTAPAWYGGTVMSGTAAASWKTAFNGTTDATATNAAAVTIAGGLGVAKKLRVGDTAIVPDLTIGSTNEYGDAYTPIYWHEGVPTVVTLTQQCAFTINSGMSGVRLSHAAITANSYVTQIVVTSGEANLNSAISWTSASGYIELTCSSTVSGDVTGYIMISRGGEITATATDIT